MTPCVLVGSVAGPWRFPVQAMKGERLEQADVAEGGPVGDRDCALVDAETGKAVSAKSGELSPGPLGCRAPFGAPPRADIQQDWVQRVERMGQTVGADTSIQRYVSAARSEANIVGAVLACLHGDAPPPVDLL